MAKARAAGGVNKSQAIRGYLDQHPDASPKEIVDALKKEGIKVSPGLVSNVKFHMGAGGTRQSKRVVKKVRRRGGAGRGGVNKSEAIRNYLQEHPDATPKEIQAGLASQGIKVSPGLVGVVKYGKQPTGAPRRGRGRIGRPSAAASSLSAQDLVQAKQLVDALGGADRARQALEFLEQLS